MKGLARIILALSLPGLLLSLLGIFVLSRRAEGALWLALWALTAIFIARRTIEGPLILGFLAGFAQQVWAAAAHQIFFGTFLEHRPDEAAWLLSSGGRAMEAFSGVVTAALSGIIVGILSLVAFHATKLVKRSA